MVLQEVRFQGNAEVEARVPFLLLGVIGRCPGHVAEPLQVLGGGIQLAQDARPVAEKLRPPAEIPVVGGRDGTAVVAHEAGGDREAVLFLHLRPGPRGRRVVMQLALVGPRRGIGDGCAGPQEECKPGRGEKAHHSLYARLPRGPRQWSRTFRRRSATSFEWRIISSKIAFWAGVSGPWAPFSRSS